MLIETQHRCGLLSLPRSLAVPLPPKTIRRLRHCTVVALMRRRRLFSLALAHCRHRLQVVKMVIEKHHNTQHRRGFLSLPLSLAVSLPPQTVRRLCQRVVIMLMRRR
jgi:hypothetical protein